jgi:hypothetical protein
MPFECFGREGGISSWDSVIDKDDWMTVRQRSHQGDMPTERGGSLSYEPVHVSVAKRLVRCRCGGRPHHVRRQMKRRGFPCKLRVRQQFTENFDNGRGIIFLAEHSKPL